MRVGQWVYCHIITTFPHPRSWFDLVLWHINHCRLFNAKSYTYKQLFQIIQFSISTAFCLHTDKCKNSSILNKYKYTV